jgi:RNase P/RNase MRP subunit p29
MFDINETYWFVIHGEKKYLTIKGKVIEEDTHMVKVVTDMDNEFIVVKASIINVNKEKKL